MSWKKNKTQPAQRNDIFETYPVKKAVLTLAIPTILNSLVTTLYNMIDTFWISMTKNTSMVAAVSIGFSSMMVLSAVGTIFSVGGSSLISRCLGAKRIEDAKRTSTICIYLSCVWGALVTVFSLFFIDQVAAFVGATGENLDYTKQYLFWCLCIGAIPTILQMTLGGEIRSEGNAKYEMIGAVMGHLFNIVGDPVFIFIFKMGVAGAALATMLSSLISCIYYIYFIIRSEDRTVIKFSHHYFCMDWSLMKEIFVVGIPSALEQLLNSAAMIVMNRLLVSYGDNYMSAMGIVQKLQQIPQQASSGFTQGAMPLIGYNYSAKKYDRMNESRKYAMRMTLAVCLVFLAIYEAFAKQLFGIFLNAPDVLAIGVKFLRIYVLSLPLMTIVFAYRSNFQALGMGFRSFAVSLCRKGLIFIPVVILFNNIFGVYGIVWAQVVSDAISLIISYLLYLKVLKLVNSTSA